MAKMKGIFVQLYSTYVLSMTIFFGGFSLAWPSYALPLLESASSPLGFQISKDESSLIGSLPMLGAFIPTLFSAYLADTIGRKNSKIICVLCFVLSWSLMATAKSVLLIYIARLMSGIGMGMDMIIIYSFISEYTQDSVRGTLISLVAIQYTGGGLGSYVAGWFLSYSVNNYLNLTLTVLTLVLTSFLKETPAFLLGQDREKEALASLKFYRGESRATPEVIDELAYIKGLINEQKKPKADAEEGNENEKEMLQEDQKGYVKGEEMSAFQMLYKSTPVWRALVTVLLQINLMVFMGTIAVTVYAGQMFSEAAPGLSSHMCSVIMAVVILIGSVLSMVCSDLVPRRVLMISTGIVCTICLAVLASLLRWRWAHEWAVPVVILLFNCVFQIGVANVPFVQLAECFPTKVKSLVNTLVMGTMGISNFIVVVTFRQTVDWLGLDVTFSIYAAVTGLTTIMAYFFMKETRKVPLEQIIKMFEEGWLYTRKRS